MEFVARPGGWFCACALVLVLLSINMRRKMGEKPNCQKNSKRKKTAARKCCCLLF